MYPSGFNNNNGYFPFYPLQTLNSNNNNFVNPLYPGNNNYYYSDYEIDLEMSNLIHKFTEKVGVGSEDDENQQQQMGRRSGQGRSTRNQQQQHQQQSSGMMGQNSDNNMMMKDQYDLGRTGGGMDTNVDTGMGMGMQGSQRRMGGGYMGQQQQQRGGEMGSQEGSMSVGRGFKHDWETSENMRQSGGSGSRQQGRNL